MELNEAIKQLKEKLIQRDKINKIEDKEEREIEKSAYFEEMPFEAIDTVLEELNNRIPRKDIEDKIEELEEELKYEIAKNEAKIQINLLKGLLEGKLWKK